MNSKPQCLKHEKFDFWDILRWGIFSKRRLFKLHYEALPLWAVTIAALSMVPIVSWHRTFITTIDVRLGGSLPRWEMASKPQFFDLRNPRNLKFMKTYDWKPTIHLDNRYRLMRGEPMLDANGNVTDEIGEDETGHEFVV